MNKMASTVLSPWDIKMLRARHGFLSQVTPEVLRLCDEVERIQGIIEGSKKAAKEN